jgi:hypothetical protein
MTVIAPFVPQVHPDTRARLYGMLGGNMEKAHELVSKVKASNPQLAWMQAIEQLKRDRR